MYNVSIYPISVYYGVSTTIAQLFPVSQNIVNTAFCFLSSPLMSKLGMRHLVVLCFFLGGVFNLLMPWGPFIYSLIIRIITDFMYAFIGPTRSPLMRATVSSEKFRATMSLNTSLQCIGAVVSPLLAGIFCDSKLSWFGIPIFIGCCSLVASLYFLLSYPKIPKPQKPTKLTEPINNDDNNGTVVVKHGLFTNPKFDVIGSILLIILILSLCVVLIEFSMLPLWLLLTLLGVFVLSVILYVVHGKHLKSGHIIPFEVFKNKRFMLNIVTSSIAIGSLRVPQILAPLVMQQAFGFSSTLTGLINAITIPLGQLLCGILLSVFLKRAKPHVLFAIFMFMDGICAVAMCMCMLLPTPIPLILVQFFSAYFTYTVNSLGGQNSMIYADPKFLSISSCVQEMSTSLGGVIGQFIAVTIRDIITPKFVDPTNPLSSDAIKMSSMISGIIIATIVFIASPIAYLTGRVKQNTETKTIQNAVISIPVPEGTGNTNEGLSELLSSEFSNTQDLPQKEVGTVDYIESPPSPITSSQNFDN